MNKTKLTKEAKKKKIKARQAHNKRYNNALLKRAEKETYHLQRDAEKFLNKNTHIVRSTSEDEQKRIAVSNLPKEKIEIENVKEYRKKRNKRLRAK